jgi:hypothetical protein
MNRLAGFSAIAAANAARARASVRQVVCHNRGAKCFSDAYAFGWRTKGRSMRTLLVAITLLASVSVADYLLYNNIYREDLLRLAQAPLVRANAGAPGVHRITFAAIEAAGSEKWLAGPVCFGSRAFSICYGSSNWSSRTVQCGEFARCVQSERAVRENLTFERRMSEINRTWTAITSRQAALGSQNSMTLVNSTYTNGWYR